MRSRGADGCAWPGRGVIEIGLNEGAGSFDRPMGIERGGCRDQHGPQRREAGIDDVSRSDLRTLRAVSAAVGGCWPEVLKFAALAWDARQMGSPQL